MRIVKCAALGFLVFGGLAAQTVQEGQGVFINNENPIVLAIVSSVAVEKINSPYVFFRAYMATSSGKSISVPRQNVVMIYKGQEYHMPTYKELQSNYKAQRNDAQLYNVAGKEALVLSQMRNWTYTTNSDFFPLPGVGMPAEQGSFAGTIGFATSLYFKNPGFKKGDELAIRVTDKSDPSLFGECGVILQ